MRRALLFTKAWNGYSSAERSEVVFSSDPGEKKVNVQIHYVVGHRVANGFWIKGNIFSCTPIVRYACFFVLAILKHDFICLTPVKCYLQSEIKRKNDLCTDQRSLYTALWGARYSFCVLLRIFATIFIRAFFKFVLHVCLAKANGMTTQLTNSLTKRTMIHYSYSLLC